jgi:integrase
MRVLRALFNFAAGEYEDIKGKSLFPENPVNRLSHSRSWYRIERRQSVIKVHQLPAWFNAVMKLETDRHNSKARTIRDYLLLILFTGLRRTEAASLKWQQIDFVGKSLTVHETKNYQAHILPLSTFLNDLLLERCKIINSDFVFPGEGATGYIAEPRKQMKKITEICGIEFTLHDLRRTFITVAESLYIPAYALKKLLNHRMHHDVTAGYIIIDIGRLRKPMQMITDYFLSCIGVNSGAEVIELKSFLASSIG